MNSPAGGTESSLTNSLRVFVSFTPVHLAQSTFRKVFPDPAHCAPLPSPRSCTCVPSQAVRVDHLSRDHYVTYNATAGEDTSGAARCAAVVPNRDFQQEPHSEKGATAHSLNADGTPVLDENPFVSFDRWFHGGETTVLEMPRLLSPGGSLLYALWARRSPLIQRLLLPSSAKRRDDHAGGVSRRPVLVHAVVPPRVPADPRTRTVGLREYHRQSLAVRRKHARWGELGVGTLDLLHRSVGANGSVNVTIPPFVQGFKDFFSVSVFAASRSCSLDSHFYLEASDTPAFDFLANLNSFEVPSRETWSWNQAVWNETGSEAILQSQGSISVSPVQSNAYGLSFTLKGVDSGGWSVWRVT